MTPPGSHPAVECPASERLALERRVEELEREGRELWMWVEHLERLAESGLHARGLAHDLGNSLMAIMASSELASMQSDPEENRRAVEMNLANSRKAAERLHTYIAFTRRDDPGLGPVSVSEVLEDAVRFLAHPLRKAEMDVTLPAGDGPRVAITHPRLLQVLTQALLTLIHGARTRGGRITTSERMDGREVVVDLRRVPSADAENGRRQEAPLGSTGFELHLAREILERAGGRMLGEPSDGLTGMVRIVLPVAPDKDTPVFGTPEPKTKENEASEVPAWRAWSGGWTRQAE